MTIQHELFFIIGLLRQTAVMNKQSDSPEKERQVGRLIMHDEGCLSTGTALMCRRSNNHQPSATVDVRELSGLSAAAATTTTIATRHATSATAVTCLGLHDQPLRREAQTCAGVISTSAPRGAPYSRDETDYSVRTFYSV